jgi:hypothetical protein
MAASDDMARTHPARNGELGAKHLCQQSQQCLHAVTYPEHVVKLLSITTESHLIDHALQVVQLCAAVALLALQFKLHLAASLGLLALVMVVLPHLQARG